MGGTPRDWEAASDATIDGTEPTLAGTEPTDPGLDGGGELTGTTIRFRARSRVRVAGDRLGRYVLEAQLGEGTMGQVWRARDPQLDREVAIKVVHPSIARGPDGAARLLREARAMAKLSHRNVVAVHDAGDDGGQLFVAMELVDGLTLGDVLRGRVAGRPRDWRRVLALFIDAGRGLAAAHAAGVLHRDFKPDNVLIDRAGRVCVGDFGLAAFGGGGPRRSSPAGAVADELTATGTVLGTPAFMSPEQLYGRAIDERSDLFSFCVALYEALYREHPFFGATPVTIGALLEAIDSGAIRAAPRPDPVPRWLRAAVLRGLAPDPAARWPSMVALLAVMARGQRRVPPVLVGAVGAAVVAAVVAAIVVVRAERTPRPPALAPTPAGSTAVRRFDVSMATRIALSADGRRLAMATVERLDVRDLDTGQLWTHLDPALTRIDRVQFDGPDRVLFASPVPLRLSAFTLATGVVEEVWRDPAWTSWLGRLAAGELVARPSAGGWDVGLAAAGAVRPVARLTSALIQSAVAPGGLRLAGIEEDRYAGHIVVVGGDGSVVRSPSLPGLTSVSWLADEVLVYATGTVDHPTIYTARFAAGAIGPGQRVHTAERGWFGQLVAGGGRLVFIDSGATFRGRVIDRGGGARSVRDLDTGTVGAVLGWLDDGRFLTWNRGTSAVEVHGRDGPIATTAARIDGEPANATRAGDVVIAAVRRDQGRELVAVSLADGRERWRRSPGWARAVRCAGDRGPPCLIIAEEPDGGRALRFVDPATGVEGAWLALLGRVDDVAVSGDGARALVSDGTGKLQLVELATGAVTPIVGTVAARGLAFDPRGGLLVAGTVGGNQYQVHRIDGDVVEVLLQSRNEILYMPRPSPDGDTVLAMGRLFLPVVYELPRRAD